MLKSRLLLILFLFCLPCVIAGQANNSKYRLNGTFYDLSGSLIPYLTLSLKKGGEVKTFYTGFDGKYDTEISNGDYEITLTEFPTSDFRAFVKIVGEGPNPKDLNFTIDMSTLCYSGQAGSTLPKILKSATPTTPAAAKAVRAAGVVTVSVEIDRDGKVTKAESVSGHPLLRLATQEAAKQFLFETGDSPVLRKVSLKFLFIEQDFPKQKLQRFDCPYRIIVPIDRTMVIDTTASIDPPSLTFFGKFKRWFRF